MRLFKYFSLLLCVLILNSCLKPEDSPVDGTDLGAGIITGSVKDADGYPLSGVLVKAGGASAITDANGKYKIDNAPKGDYVKIDFTKQGYSANQKISKIEDSKTAYENAALAKIGITQTISAAGGTINFKGSTIIFPANAFVDSKGNPFTGNATVEATYFDPANTNYFELFPGRFEGIRTDGSVSAVASYGFIDVEIYSGSEKLQLASGKKAQINVPLASNLTNNPPAKMPTWWYDRTTGQWKEEGEATLASGKYSFSVSHFTPWNVDVPIETCYIKGKVKATDGSFVDRFLVNATTTNMRVRFSTYTTGEENTFVVRTQANTQVDVRAYAGGFSNPESIVATSKANDTIDIGTITVDTKVTEKDGWYQIFSGASTDIYSMGFFDDNVGLINTGPYEKSNILITKDAGSSWTINYQFKPEKSYGALPIKIVDNQVAFAATSLLLHKTTNQGRDWAEITLPNPQLYVSGLEAFDENHLTVLSWNGCHITSDGGQNWNQVVLGNSLTYTQSIVQYINKDVLFAVNLEYLRDSSTTTKFAAVYKSIDGGQSWNKTADLNREGTKFYEVYKPELKFFNENEGIIQLGATSLFKTVDGGITWNKITTPAININSMFFVNNKVGWIMDVNNKIYKTSDGGNNWTIQNIPENKNTWLRGMYFRDEKLGFIYGTGGVIYKTTTGGEE